MSDIKVAQLIHYASPYYDQVKAHEYYMRTRQLKGRRKASDLNEEGRRIWTYTKGNIKSEKDAKVKEEQEKRKQKIEELRSRSKAMRKMFSVQLKNFMDKLSVRYKSDRKNLSDNLKSEIKKITAIKIPKGISKEKRAELMAERREKIAKIRSDYEKERDKVSENTKNGQTSFRDRYKGEKERVVNEVRSAIQATREAYKQAKTNLDSSYEDIYQREFDKIASEYENTRIKRRHKK